MSLQDLIIMGDKIESLESELALLREENKEMREALEFYASFETWLNNEENPLFKDGAPYLDCEIDSKGEFKVGGLKARSVLAKWRKA